MNPGIIQDVRPGVDDSFVIIIGLQISPICPHPHHIFFVKLDPNKMYVAIFFDKSINQLDMGKHDKGS